MLVFISINVMIMLSNDTSTVHSIDSTNNKVIIAYLR